MTTKRRSKKNNLKRNQARVPFPSLLAGILVIFVVLGLSYVWVDTRCHALGKDIKRKEAELISSKKRLVNEQDRWSSITSPANLERAIRKHRLGMAMPRESQVVRIGRWDISGKTAMTTMRRAGL